jgi:hypothetical protein
MPRLSVYGQTREVDVDPDTPLLWVLRDTLGLTGTKYGCGIAQCGACTAMIDGAATRSCSLPVSAAEGVESPMTAADHVTAIHVFNQKNPQPHIAVFRLGPRTGVARVATRIRLADSQKIVAVARMSDAASGARAPMSS